MSVRAGYKLARLEARAGIATLIRERRPSLVAPLPPLRLQQHHLTIPSLPVELTQGGTR